MTDLPITSTLVVAYLLGAVGTLACFADLVLTLPPWATLLAIASLVTGMVLVSHLTFTHARRSGRPWVRTLLSTLWAPVKFLLDFTF